MSEARELANKHLEALIEEAVESKIPKDVVGRALLARLVEEWTRERGWQDVASELRFTADNIDPDADFEFMRP